MQCALCNELIDEDSLYCDMCGEEIKACPKCNKTGKAKMCTSCGIPLVTITSMSQPVNEEEKLADMPDDLPLKAKVPLTPASAIENTYRLPEGSIAPQTVVQLDLLNKTINADIKIEDGAIIGRTSGAYVSIFGSFNQVSGKHCRFNYNPHMGWSVTDLGSTNKTTYNNRELSPNISQPLSDQSFLKIANIEFFVRITSG